jgi:hypothetical protein
MRFFMLVVSCCLVAGCQSDAKKFEELADRACECADGDTACGNKVLADVVKLAEDQGKGHSDERITHAGVRMVDCLTSLGLPPKELTAALERM